MVPSNIHDPFIVRCNMIELVHNKKKLRREKTLIKPNLQEQSSEGVL